MNAEGKAERMAMIVKAYPELRALYVEAETRRIGLELATACPGVELKGLVGEMAGHSAEIYVDSMIRLGEVLVQKKASK